MYKQINYLEKKRKKKIKSFELIFFLSGSCRKINNYDKKKISYEFKYLYQHV